MLFLGFPLLRVLVIAGGFNPYGLTGHDKKSRTTEGRYNFKWRHFVLFSNGILRMNKTVLSVELCIVLFVEQPAEPLSYIEPRSCTHEVVRGGG